MEAKEFTRTTLENEGFAGFVTVHELQEAQIEEVPGGAGIYVVLREKDSPPVFLASSPAGRFKGKDPTVRGSVLRAKWVEGAHTLYIGKTDQSVGLRQRVKDLLNFAAGKPVAHWGGRYLWQVADASDFVIAWRETGHGIDPGDEESRLLRKFQGVYEGRFPFANLRE